MSHNCYSKTHFVSGIYHIFAKNLAIRLAKSCANRLMRTIPSAGGMIHKTCHCQILSSVAQQIDFQRVFIITLGIFGGRRLVENLFSDVGDILLIIVAVEFAL